MHAIICVFDFVHFTFWAYGVGRLLMDIGWQSVPYSHEECRPSSAVSPTVNKPLKSETHGQTYGYLPGRRASPHLDRYPGTSAEFWLGGLGAPLPPEAKKI